MMENSITISLQICPNTSTAAPTHPYKQKCAHIVSTLFPNNDCSRPICRIVRFIQSRKLSIIRPITVENLKKFNAVAKTFPVPFVLCADFEAFLIPVDNNKDSASNTKVLQLHKSNGFACLRVSQVPNLMARSRHKAVKIV